MDSLEVTKIILRNSRYKRRVSKCLVTCDIVLNDCLKLMGVRLYKRDGSYFLVFPSKEDIYQEITELNKNKEEEIVFPMKDPASKKKDFEEFFFPMSQELYKRILNDVVNGYLYYKDEKDFKGDSCTYIPKN